MANFIALCYATAKKAGIDTSKMTPDEVVEWYNKQQGTSQAKGKATELIKEYVGASKQKEGANAKIEKVEKIEKSTNNVNSDEKFKEYFVEKIDRNNTEQVKSKVNEYMNRIVKDNKEHSVIIDKEGNVFEKTGDETYIEDIGLDLYGAIDIHNHLGDGSFEKDDFMFFKDKLNTDFIAITPKYIHKVKVLKEIDKPYNYFYIRGMKKDDDGLNQAHNVMEFIKSEGYIDYERISRDS